jgi:predicted dehydrogenase
MPAYPYGGEFRIFGSKGFIDSSGDVTLDAKTEYTIFDLAKMPHKKMGIENRKTSKKISGRKLAAKYYNNLDKNSREKLFPLGISGGPWSNEASDKAIVLVNFYNAITQGIKPEVDGDEGLKDVALCYSVVESSYLNQPVKVKQIEDGKISNYQKEIDEKLGLM